MGPTPRKKEKKLTSHTAAMHLMIQFPSNGVVPRERFSPIPQLFMGTTSKQRAEQLMAHGQVVHNLEHVDQYGDGHREQNQ